MLVYKLACAVSSSSAQSSPVQVVPDLDSHYTAQRVVVRMALAIRAPYPTVHGTSVYQESACQISDGPAVVYLPSVRML